jgi:hypothetical protein
MVKDEKKLNKINLYGLHVCDSWNNTKWKKIENILKCSFIKFPPLSYDNGFFFKIYIIIYLLLKKCKKIHQNFKLLIGSRFNLCVLVSFIIK